MKKVVLIPIIILTFIFISIPAMAAEQNYGEQSLAEMQITVQVEKSDNDQNQYQFNDIETHWAREQIELAYQWGLVKGYPNGSFNPNGNISGAEGLVMISRIMEYLVAEAGAQVEENDDEDLHIFPLWAREQVINIQTTGLSQFYGEAQLNRLYFAVLLSRVMGLEGEEANLWIGEFTDQDEIQEEYLGGIYALKNREIINGYMGEFSPNRLVTRAEAVTMLIRCLEMLGVAPSEYIIDGDKLIITLPENPTTGYLWTYEMDKAGIMELERDEYIADQAGDPIVGAGGEHKWVLKKQDEGRVKISFYYMRAGEDTLSAIMTRVFIVDIKSLQNPSSGGG